MDFASLYIENLLVAKVPTIDNMMNSSLNDTRSKVIPASAGTKATIALDTYNNGHIEAMK